MPLELRAALRSLARSPGFDEEIGGTADLHGRVSREGFAEAEGDQPFLKERIEGMDGDHSLLPPLVRPPGRLES